MMVLIFISAIYIIIYPYVIAPNQQSTDNNATNSSSYETAENAARVISDNEDEVTNATQAAIAAIVEKENANAPVYEFKTPDKLYSHYEKHGPEMGFENENEYLEGANRLINNPDALHKTEAEDGDDIYYLEDTDEIAFVSTDGYIRTYFICSGKEYFDKQ